MNEKLTFEYDQLGDILYVVKAPAYPEQESEEIEEGVVARLNPNTSEVESLEIISFHKRLSLNPSFSLPLICKLFKSA
jgi:uncharacterized protein YuzE